MAPFGARLKQEREKRGITLDAVALSTKIGTRFLRALEEEHFDQLPGGIFNRGFVRAYARCVGLDEDQTVADYLLASREALPKKTEVTEPVQPPSPKGSAPKARKPKEILAERVEPQPEVSGDASDFPWVPVVSVIILVVLGLAIWRFMSRESSGSAGTGSTSTSASVTATKPSPPTPQSTATQTPTAVPAGTVVTNPSAVPATFSVRIKASEDSWVSVTADGKPVFEDTMEELAEKSLEAHSEMVVKVGNLGGLDFWFNGTKLPVQGEEGEVKTLTFDTNGLRPQVPKPQPAEAPTPSP